MLFFLFIYLDKTPKRNLWLFSIHTGSQKTQKNPPNKPYNSWGGDGKATLTLLHDNHLTASHRFKRLQAWLALRRAWPPFFDTSL